MGALSSVKKGMFGKLAPQEDDDDWPSENKKAAKAKEKAAEFRPTFTSKVSKNGKRTFHIVVSPFIDRWAKRRKALLILGLVFCQQAIKGEKVDRAELEANDVEPEIIDAALTLVTVMFGDEE